MPTAPAPSPLSTGTRAVFTLLREPSQRSRHLPRCSTNRWVSSIRKERESGTATHLTRLDSRRRAASDNHLVQRSDQKSLGAGVSSPFQFLTLPSLALINPRRHPWEPSRMGKHRALTGSPTFM